MFFQNNIIKKYISSLPEETVQQAWTAYSACFLNTQIQENIRASKEEQFQEGFLRELFVKVLGYTLNPTPDFNLITEQKNETDSKKADGAILHDGKVTGIIELKDHKTTDLSQVERQAFGYKHQHPQARYVVISNFEKLRFYIDNAVEYIEWNLFTLTEEQFRLLYFCLSWDTLSRDLPQQAKNESVSSEDQITQQLYRDYSAFKRELFEDILDKNQPNLADSNYRLPLFKKTQKLLDRLLFIFFAEDCGLLPPNSMIMILDQWEKLRDMDAYFPLYDRIKKYFGYLDTGYHGKHYDIFAYNGGLFKPDEILDSLVISDDILAYHTRRLSEYDYASEVDVNILGHIFENSLNEIEEFYNNADGDVRAPSKRKRDGVFYTPQYITKYIVENTVGRLCAEKKTDLGLCQPSLVGNKNKRAQLALLEQYRSWLLGITICDPACGSGAFLNAALQFLMAEHRLIDEMQAKITGDSIVFQNIENSILENNLYGVDINEESVEIARLALWLRTAKPYRKLTSLNNNIRCGNSLISDPAVAGEKAFDWEKEFPQVFAKGGFDVVIGNPPYGASLSNIEQNWLESNYQLKTTDTAALFMKLALQIAKQGTPVGYIIPKPFLYASTWKTIRKEMLPFIFDIVDCSKVWKEVKLEQIIFIAVKGNPCDRYNSFTRNETEFKFIVEIDKSLCETFGFYVNGVSENEISIAKKMLLCKSSLNDLVQNQRGAMYQKEVRETEAELEVLGGKQIGKYTTKGIKGYISAEIANEDKGFIKDNSLLVQNIIAFIENPQPHIKITANIVESKDIVILDTINQLTAKSDISSKYILALINSKLISWYVYRFVFGLAIRTMHFDNAVTEKIPIPSIPLESQQPFITLADKMLALNKDLQEKRGRFLRRLQGQPSMAAVKITTAMETFDTLDFAGFVAELKKQKVHLTLVQQDEWEDYFGQYKTGCEALRAEIEKTDQEIDRLVYDLYGLTEEEIKTVEGK